MSRANLRVLCFGLLALAAGLPDRIPGNAACQSVWAASGDDAPQAVSLAEALRHLQAEDILVADAAVEEIVAHGEAGAEALLPFLDDTRRDVRAGAIRGLGLLAEMRAAEPIRAILEASLEGKDPETMEDRYLKVLSIQAIGRIGDPACVELLERVAATGDPFERAHAGISLFLLKADPGYDLVSECLADTAVAIRNLAVEGLGASADSRARDLVLPMTGDASWVVRDTAFRSLERWGGDEEVRAAFRRGSEDPSWYVRETVREIEAKSGRTGGRG